MRRAVVVIAIACGVASAVLCWKVLGLIPHVSDELSYLYQARILASGHLFVDPPVVPEAFTVRWDHILRVSGKWRAMYPPGWPLLLATGWWIHAPWLINPIFLSFSIFGVFKLAKQLFDERTALIAVIAFACSPFVLLMGAGFMAHPSTLCFAVWCAFFMARGERYDYVFAGAAGAFAFLIRPYTTVPLLLPFLLWSIWNTQNKIKTMLQLAAGAFPLLIIFSTYNSLLFDSMFRTGYSFDPDADFRGSLFQYFRLNVPWYFSKLNRSLWDWPWPDLLIFAPLLVPHKKWKVDVVLAVCFLSLLSAYAFFYYRDIVYAGPRYVYESVGFLAILAARSIRLLEEMFRFTAETLRRRLKKEKNSVLSLRVGDSAVKLRSVMLLLFIYPLLATLPERMDYYSQGYHGQSKELLDLVKSKGIGRNALVLISGDPYVLRTFYLENSLNPADSERVFAKDVPGMHEAIVQAYGRAEIWKMQIELVPLRGVNDYADRSAIRSVQFQRLR